MPDASKISGFFAVDHRTWARICGLGLNAAVAYLVLARGTGKTNRETAWSVQAIEKHTGIARSRAHAAISNLLDDRVVRQLRGGTRPKYVLLPWHLLRGNDRREPLTTAEQKIFDRVAQGDNIVSQQDQKIGGRAVAKGWLIDHGDGRYTIAPDPAGCPDWIWLPNELVTGAAGETPPIELVRQVQDVMTLRLLVDFYHSQNLRDGPARNTTG